MHKFNLIVVRDLCELFESAIKMIEGNEIAGFEAVKTVEDLQQKMQNVIDSSFLSFDAQEEFERISEVDPDIDQQTTFDTIIKPLYGKYLIDNNYHI